MSTVKKIIADIVEKGGEAVKDSAKQLGKAVSPEEMLKQMSGQQRSEFTEYLKNLGPNLTPEELEKRKQELSKEDQEKLEETRKNLLKPTVPNHMRPPPKPPAARPYEVTTKEEEQTKKARLEAQRRAPLIVPKGAKKSPILPGFKKPKSMEGLTKDTKVG